MEIHSGSIEAANALAWLVAAGADVIVDEAPRNWLAAPAPARPAPTVRPVIEAPRVAAVKPAPVIDAPDLAALETAVAAFAHPLRQSSPPQLLTGNTASGVIILADQPDAEDSEAATLMTKMLAAIGLDPSGCARAHLLPWSPIAGRAGRDEEIAAYAPFAARALALAAPKFILAFGEKAAARADGAAPRGINSVRGKWLTLGNAAMLATFHPRQLVTQPDLKRLAWADLQAFQARMAS